MAENIAHLLVSSIFVRKNMAPKEKKTKPKSTYAFEDRLTTRGVLRNRSDPIKASHRGRCLCKKKMIKAPVMNAKVPWIRFAASSLFRRSAKVYSISTCMGLKEASAKGTL
jgi:hypothetical protein